MDNIKALAEKLKKTNKNAYQKLNWINKGAISALPDGCDRFFDEVIAFLRADCKADVAFMKESKKKYQQINAKKKVS